MTERAAGEAAIPHRPAPRYAAIEQRFAAAIASGALPPGLVVTEDPVAKLFGTSRTPVRTAFNELERRGLLERFDGRGFVVPGAEEPRRLALTRAMLGLGEDDAAPKPITSDRIARDFEAAVAQALPFGQYQVIEQAAADHYGVSRTVVRELLSRFQDRGLVSKDERSHWVVGPLTAQDIAHHFTIRAQLEPVALTESAPHIPPAELTAMFDRARTARPDGDSLPPETLERLETDVHVTLLARSANPHLLRMINQSQVALSVNQVFAETVGTRPFSVALAEHCIIYEFLSRGAWDAAADALREHLRLSALRTRKRLMSISVFPEPALPDYLRKRPA